VSAAVPPIETRAEHLLPPARAPFREVGMWAMLLFIATEATLFAYLITSYFFLGVSNPSWPPAGFENPKLELPLIMTALLLSSSVVLYAAEQYRKRGRIAAYRGGTALTIVLGLGFLLLQAREYADKLKHMPPSSHAYASMFFLITGFHGAHVALGLLMLLWTLLADVRGRLAVIEPLALKNTSLYWHFVDGVWLVILTCLYVSPRWY
jgi:heme/copper-type cytochrome/quinol oxidase subunit 3